ncbi:hypothetical protein D3C77_581610 [compost metagenome]
MHPVRQIGVQAVIHPLALTAILQHTAAAQQREMTGDLRLAFFQCRGQFADAQLTLAGYQQGHARAGFVGQGFENRGGGQVLDHGNPQRLFFTSTNILMRSCLWSYCSS